MEGEKKYGKEESGIFKKMSLQIPHILVFDFWSQIQNLNCPAINNTEFEAESLYKHHNTFPLMRTAQFIMLINGLLKDIRFKLSIISSQPIIMFIH